MLCSAVDHQNYHPACVKLWNMMTHEPKQAFLNFFNHFSPSLANFLCQSIRRKGHASSHTSSGQHSDTWEYSEKFSMTWLLNCMEAELGTCYFILGLCSLASNDRYFYRSSVCFEALYKTKITLGDSEV